MSIGIFRCRKGCKCADAFPERCFAWADGASADARRAASSGRFSGSALTALTALTLSKAYALQWTEWGSGWTGGRASRLLTRQEPRCSLPNMLHKGIPVSLAAGPVSGYTSTGNVFCRLFCPGSLGLVTSTCNTVTLTQPCNPSTCTSPDLFACCPCRQSSSCRGPQASAASFLHPSSFPCLVSTADVAFFCFSACCVCFMVFFTLLPLCLFLYSL